MKPLLAAVAVVAALCALSLAAPPDEEPTKTVYPDAHDANLSIDPVGDQRLRADEVFPDSSDQDPKLREQYLRIVQNRAKQMSDDELRTAIRAALAETERARAEKTLQEAADILAEIYREHPNTEHATYAARMLNGLMQLGISSDKVQLKRISDSFQVPTSSQVPDRALKLRK